MENNDVVITNRPNNTLFDVHLCAYVQMMLTMARFHARIEDGERRQVNGLFLFVCGWVCRVACHADRVPSFLPF